MLEIVFQFIGEFLVQTVFEGLAELGMHSLREPFRKRPHPGWLTMSVLGWWRAGRGQDVVRLDRFGYGGYLFALSLALVRFWLAH